MDEFTANLIHRHRWVLIIMGWFWILLGFAWVIAACVYDIVEPAVFFHCGLDLSFGLAHLWLVKKVNKFRKTRGS